MGTRESDSLTPEQVAEYEAALTRHYGEPVRPVSVYCDAFRAWAKALHARETNDAPDARDANLDRVGRLVNDPGLSLAIAKSSMLGRLIYGGETLRTVLCPEHKGVWCGIGVCRYGCDHTGWLPAED